MNSPLRQRHPQRLRVCEWTDRIDVYLRACDLVVGKPGGISVAEALACGRPLLATRSLGGQEGFNVGFLERHRVGGLVADGELFARVACNARRSHGLAPDAAARLAFWDGATAPLRVAELALDLAAARPSLAQTRHEAAALALHARRLVSSMRGTTGAIACARSARCCTSDMRAIAVLNSASTDGTVLRDNDPIGRLHFNNASIAALGEGSMHRVGFRFASLMRESLRTLAEVAHSDPALRDVRVFQGITWLPAHGEVVGFVSTPMPQNLADAAARASLSHADVGLRARGAHSRTRHAEPRLYWLTRTALTQNLGKLKQVDG